MEQINKLNTDFSTPCNTVVYKEVGSQLKTIGNKLSTFMQVKSYRKLFPENSTDQKNRYAHMMQEICDKIKESTKVNEFLTDVDNFFNALYTFLTDDDIYDLSEDAFSKGSFKNVGEKINKLINPKKDDDPCEELENVSKYIFQYQPRFENLFKEFVETNSAYVYSVVLPIDNTYNNTMKKLVFGLCKLNIVYFGLSRENEDTVQVLIASISPIEEYEQNMCNTSTFIDLASVENTEIIKVTTYVSLDTVKSAFKSESEDLNNILKITGDICDFHYYSTIYKNPSDYDEISEMNLPNILKGLVKSTENYMKNMMTLFLLHGDPGNIVIEGYWLVKGDIHDAMSEFDRDAYTWTEISIDEYQQCIKNKGSLDTQCML